MLEKLAMICSHRMESLKVGGLVGEEESQGGGLWRRWGPRVGGVVEERRSQGGWAMGSRGPRVRVLVGVGFCILCSISCDGAL